MADGRYAPTKPRDISDREQQKVSDTLVLFSELQTYRNVHAGQCEEAAALILPTSRNTFFYGSYNWPGAKKTQQQVDATGARALNEFCAIADSLVTPKSQKWHGLKSDPYVMKDRATRLYFDQVRDILFDLRYRPIANFHGQNYNNWQSLGAFGNSIMFVDALDGRWHSDERGFRYRSIPLGEAFFAENHQGIVTTIVRWFRKTAAQAVEAWGIDALPAMMRPALDKGLQTPYQFLHCVKPRSLDEFDPKRLDEKGKPFESYYVSIDGKCLMGPESGYRRFPYAVSRYDQTPGEVYGRGPAQIVLPSLKTLNAQKTTFLKQAHRAADPVLLMVDDGMVNFDLRPGAKNPGGMSSDGRPLVGTLPTGNIQVSKEAMEEERNIIDGGFLTSLFKVLSQHPDMTATQVIELLNERGMLVAPTLGRQHNEYVGGLVERELDLAVDMRNRRGEPMLPPMPPRLREAMGEYQIVDTSPLAMAARANEAAGLYRTVEFLRGIANDTGDPSALDRIDLDTAAPEVAQINGVPERWIADDNKVAAKRKNRALAQQRQEQIRAMPAQAAMMKAQAVQAKAGVPGPGQQPQGMPQ